MTVTALQLSKTFLLFLLPLLPLWGQTPATVVHTEANLYQVDSLLYRSEQLVRADKEVIKRTPIKTIINLRYFTRSKDRKVFLLLYAFLPPLGKGRKHC